MILLSFLMDGHKEKLEVKTNLKKRITANGYSLK